MLTTDQEDGILERIELESAFKKLDKRLQAVLALKMGGFTMQHIAQLLGISRTSVGKNYIKAIAQLRETLESYS